jgi:hypothetical protein
MIHGQHLLFCCSKKCPGHLGSFSEDPHADAFARMECHFFTNRGFLEEDDALLKHIDVISHIPCTIIHGRYDVVSTTDSEPVIFPLVMRLFACRFARL